MKVKLLKKIRKSFNWEIKENVITIYDFKNGEKFSANLNDKGNSILSACKLFMLSIGLTFTLYNYLRIRYRRRVKAFNKNYKCK